MPSSHLTATALPGAITSLRTDTVGRQLARLGRKRGSPVGVAGILGELERASVGRPDPGSDAGHSGTG